MLCACGCGQDAGVYVWNGEGRKKGDPKKYMVGHNRKGLRAVYCTRGHLRTSENITTGGGCKECHNVKSKESNRRIRKEAIDHYGGKCVCCGESSIEFLSFDHINGRGDKRIASERRTGIGFVYWLRNNGYPEGIQILCHNCNQSFGAYGYCPHNPEIKRSVTHRPTCIKKEIQ